MLPGKTYTPEEVLSIVRRRIWYFLIPMAIVSAGTAVWTSQSSSKLAMCPRSQASGLSSGE